ncbi:minor tail protein [Gordonia phage CloverMinnie]|nr:minor tail protein [Gordonia phage CloverMinnie]UBF41630.1 minor tail protein [Gordonia phage AnarQue]UOW93011.1 minor tail protein [Gordonia phage CaiB]WNM74920.1 minor tail protein [Gordonia phage MossRose]
MPFRGYFALDGVEIANSSRVVAHLGQGVPTSDVGVVCGQLVLDEDPDDSQLYDPGEIQTSDTAGLYYPYVDTPATSCDLTEVSPGLFEIPASSGQIGNLWSPPDGSERYGQGLIEVDETCWSISQLCGSCRIRLGYDDSWPGLREYLSDTVYRPELAPWYSTRNPASKEFGGVWVLDAQGFGPTPMARGVTELVGSGAAIGVHRDTSRTLVFEALLIACTSAGLEYGLSWLTCLLRDTNNRSDAVIRYFSAHPSHTGASAASLVRELHGVVMTKAPEVKESYAGGSRRNQQATMYRVSWEMVAASPYAYLPTVAVPVEWDTVEAEPIEWVHAADCAKPESCETMPVLFSATCEPEQIEVVTSPPPSCGGCMPVCEVDRHVFRVPTMDYAFTCDETAVSVTVANTGESPVTLQMYWRVCGSDERCDNNLHPLQVAGLPAGATLTLDSITGRYHAHHDGRKRRPVGIIGTPDGSPWAPIIIDRTTCWELVVEAPGGAEFDVSLALNDREP